MKIVVVGNGKWGTAMGSVLAENGHEFSFWKKGEPLVDNSVIVWCIPTQATRQVLSEATTGPLKKVIFINGAKGVERSTHSLPFEIVREILGKNIEYFSLIGPSFAQEVVDRMPTLVNVGYERSHDSKLVHDLFETDYFRVQLTRGVKALELASAFKNVYAIGCGVADGLGFETNTRVKLILLAIEEFYKLSKKLGYKFDNQALPGTIGDLILTCNSEESRNFSFGQLLPKYSPTEALGKVKETVEGFYTLDSVPYFEKKSGVKMPLARLIYDLVKEEKTNNLKDTFTQFVKTT